MNKKTLIILLAIMSVNISFAAHLQTNNNQHKIGAKKAVPQRNNLVVQRFLQMPLRLLPQLADSNLRDSLFLSPQTVVKNSLGGAYHVDTLSNNLLTISNSEDFVFQMAIAGKGNDQKAICLYSIGGYFPISALKVYSTANWEEIPQPEINLIDCITNGLPKDLKGDFPIYRYLFQAFSPIMKLNEDANGQIEMKLNVGYNHKIIFEDENVQKIVKAVNEIEKIFKWRNNHFE